MENLGPDSYIEPVDTSLALLFSLIFDHAFSIIRNDFLFDLYFLLSVNFACWLFGYLLSSNLYNFSSNTRYWLSIVEYIMSMLGLALTLILGFKVFLLLVLIIKNCVYCYMGYHFPVLAMGTLR